MSHQVLARKWRPKQFADVIGQNPVVDALSNALQHNRLHQAYLFTGTRGVGKTTLARIFAKCLNCVNGPTPTPCQQCDNCKEIDQGKFVDLLEVDAASRTRIEDTRDLLENVQYPPIRGRYKIYLIDEVHMLSTHSFNALLKTLEEPPSFIKFLLATTDPQKLPITVLSRCLHFALRPVSVATLTQQLTHILAAENISYDADALPYLAEAGDGSVRDTLSLTDQAIALCGQHLSTPQVQQMLGHVDRKLMHGILHALLNHSAEQLLDQATQLAAQGTDPVQATKSLISLLHQIAVAQWLKKPDLFMGIDATWLQGFSVTDIQTYYQIALLGYRDLALAPNQQQAFEMLLLRLCCMEGFGIEDQHKLTPTETPASPTPIPAQNAASIISSPRLVQPITPATTTPVTITSPPTQPVESVKPGQLLPENLPADRKPSDLTNLDWFAITQTLQGDAALQNLARNCVLTHVQGNTLELQVSASRAAFNTPPIQARLTSALSAQLGQTIQIRFSIGDSTELSPQQQLEKHSQDALAAAKIQLANDPNIQALQSIFNAEIDPHSIVINTEASYEQSVR